MNQTMFCYQCQETAGCTGCTRVGVCGKKPDLAAMQDLLVFVTKGLSAVTTQLRAEGVEISTDINHLITLNLFVTITNANFDKDAIVSRIHTSLEGFMFRTLFSIIQRTKTSRTVKNCIQPKENLIFPAIFTFRMILNPSKLYDFQQ